MGRLTRDQIQQRNRDRVLAAAREEFLERGYRDAKVDTIAERADLTRGAVYSNFAGKRALYFGVLADLAAQPPEPSSQQPGRNAEQALGALARAWLARLPLATDDPRGASRLGMDLITEVLSDERIRLAWAQLMTLDAILLGLALERLRPPAGPQGRLVRLAQTALTLLHGAGQVAATAPGFSDPFNLVSACRHLATLDLGDGWLNPPFLTRADPVDDPWAPPPAHDLMTGEPADLSGYRVVAILGMHRLEAVEEAVRSGPSGLQVTCVAVAGEPAELRSLARLAVADLCNCIRQAFPRRAWPPLQVVVDDTGHLAAAAGVSVPDNNTEAAVLIKGGRVVAFAEGRGACHVVASMGRTPSS
ncbi:MAG: TetR/AcrR family transcriptional regulator [Actinomycetota bacterium]